MKKVLKRIIIVCIILIITSVGIFLEIKYLSENNKKENTINQITYLEKESIETTINNINSLFIENGISTLLENNKFIVKNNTYYYNIHKDINIYIKPIEYLQDITNEITYDIGIYYPKNSEVEGKAKIYLKILIKTNNNKLSDDEIEKIIDDALNNSKNNKEININGISIRYFGAKNNNNYKEFVIRRNYK